MKPFFFRKNYLWVFAIIALVYSCKTLQIAQPLSPNIILIMADDQGWGDVGYNGHPQLKTPNLDAMASNGAQFTRFYAASAVCSPTRASVMTGRHPLRMGICHANCGHIKTEEITLAEMLKSKGYESGMFGKWHLGTLTRDTIDANRGGRPQHDQHYAPPWDHGFDVSFVTESKVPTWNPMITPPRSAGDVRPKLEEGKEFGTFYWLRPGEIVKDNLEGDDSRVIMDRILAFIEKTTASSKPFLSVVWFHTPHLPVLTGKEYRSLYPGLSEDQQHYYGAISAMDAQVGRLRKKLRELNIEENTIIFYTSDNGPEGKEASGRTQGVTHGLSGRKRSLHEGGIRVPGLMEWPAKISPGTTVKVPCFTSDYLPTIADIVGVEISTYDRPFDGVSLMPYINEVTRQRSEPLAFSFQEQEALIDQQFKIYSDDGGENFFLYNLSVDPAEQVNLAQQEPEKMKHLVSLWRNWKTSVEASALGADYPKNE